ncbi:predicted protein [Sclerotinia sclerotiorum 1980 UF-70]|uniref:Uncharacterized protein n=1 Tax=Sclerotinia sclerotiorum (strain ATCC 18683 / 1980 / Ss-1) TaxID=665079 RepID=A7EF51_SCLS1|nr:predicted protein [Sclerotinia sclerotiorum 1980 UF-70]EDO01467.1 predicted protein [Sclerotinia sclerotiorum 1980 UF-70]
MYEGLEGKRNKSCESQIAGWVLQTEDKKNVSSKELQYDPNLLKQNGKPRINEDIQDIFR